MMGPPPINRQSQEEYVDDVDEDVGEAEYSEAGYQSYDGRDGDDRGRREEDAEDREDDDCHEDHRNVKVLDDGMAQRDAKTELWLANETRLGRVLNCECGARLSKHGGCNWVKCPINECGREWCWQCKKLKGDGGCPYMGGRGSHNSH